MGWRKIYWSAAAVILLIPAVAMQLTAAVQWSISDFVIFGAMLGVAGLAGEMVARARGSVAYKTAGGLTVMTCFFLIWANLAVGYIGDGSHPSNLLFLAIPVIPLIGAAVTRGDAAGMARVVWGALAVQIALTAVALVAGWGADSPSFPWGIVRGTAFFSILWLMSGLLFNEAARQEAEGGA